MNDPQNLNELIHSLINQTVTTQSIIRLLKKSELDDKQALLVEKSLISINDIINTAKKIREETRH